MAKLDDLNFTNLAWSILSLGETGCGKTIASCGKEFRPILVIDVDQRMASVAKYYRELDGHCNGIDYETFTMGQNFSDLDKRIDSLLKHCPYKTVCLASLTAYIHLVLSHLLEFKPGGAHKFIAGIKVNEIEDYNAEDAALIFELLGLLMQLKKKGVNVILEAHITKIDYTDLKGATTSKQQILTKGKKAPASIPGYFDECWLFTKETELVNDPVKKVARYVNKYVMQPNGTNLIAGKTSRGVKPIDWTNLDFTVELMKQFPKQAPDVKIPSVVK